MEEVVKFLEKYHSFAVFTHLNPDGDALGSAFSLTQALRASGKTARVILLETPPAKYNFEEFSSLFSLPDETDFACFDAHIAVDCADKRRLGKAKELFFERPGLNIDHHVSNTKFADVNFVEEAPSTGEIIYDIMERLCVTADQTARMALYIAISTDTGNFTYQNTTAKTLEICSALVCAGLDISYVADRVYNNRTLGATRLICRFIEHLRLHYDDKLAVSIIMLNDIEETGAKVEDCEILINYARDIESVEIAAFIREIKPDVYKVSFRSKYRANVADLAGRYDGGGHIRAAGCMMKGNLYDIIDEVVKTSGEYIG